MSKKDLEKNEKKDLFLIFFQNFDLPLPNVFLFLFSIFYFFNFFVPVSLILNIVIWGRLKGIFCLFVFLLIVVCCLLRIIVCCLLFVISCFSPISFSHFILSQFSLFFSFSFFFFFFLSFHFRLVSLYWTSELTFSDSFSFF